MSRNKKKTNRTKSNRNKTKRVAIKEETGYEFNQIFKPALIGINYKRKNVIYPYAMTPRAKRYLSHVLQYVVADLVEAAIDHALDRKSKMVQCRDIMNGIKSDENLSILCKGSIIPHAGVPYYQAPRKKIVSNINLNSDSDSS